MRSYIEYLLPSAFVPVNRNPFTFKFRSQHIYPNYILHTSRSRQIDRLRHGVIGIFLESRQHFDMNHGINIHRGDKYVADFLGNPPNFLDTPQSRNFIHQLSRVKPIDVFDHPDQVIINLRQFILPHRFAEICQRKMWLNPTAGVCYHRDRSSRCNRGYGRIAKVFVPLLFPAAATEIRETPLFLPQSTRLIMADFLDKSHDLFR